MKITRQHDDTFVLDPFGDDVETIDGSHPYGVAISERTAVDLAVTLANRALGRGVAPSPVGLPDVRLSGSRDSLVATMQTNAEPCTETVVSIRVAGSAGAWVAMALAIYCSVKREARTLDDLLAEEFGGDDAEA